MVNTIDFRIKPLPLGATVSSLVTHADIPDIDWAARDGLRRGAGRRGAV